MIPNFGVTGPMDSNNNKIFTHSFVHRTHLEVLISLTFKSYVLFDKLFFCRYLVIYFQLISRIGGLMTGSQLSMDQTTHFYFLMLKLSIMLLLRKSMDIRDMMLTKVLNYNWKMN